MALSTRTRLPDERKSIVHRFTITAARDDEPERKHVFFVIVGLYPDGRPAELFVTMRDDHGSLRGLLDSAAIATSIALQYGAPIESICAKFRGQQFYPSGPTNNAHIQTALSPIDYIGKWLALRFCKAERQAEAA